MKSILTLALTGALSTAAVAGGSSVVDTVQCAPGAQEARIERVYAGIVSYSTKDGKKGALPQAAAGGSKTGEAICLPNHDTTPRGKEATCSRAQCPH